MNLLDVIFKEDEHQLRKVNLDLLLKSVKSTIKFPNVKAKRKLASWNNDFLLSALGLVKRI